MSEEELARDVADAYGRVGKSTRVVSVNPGEAWGTQVPVVHDDASEPGDADTPRVVKRDEA